MRKTLAFSIIIFNLLFFSFTISFYLDSSITENRPNFGFTSEESNSVFEIENSVTIPTLAKKEQVFSSNSPSKIISETTISNNEIEQGSWTYMFYLAADNDIEGDAVLDVEELERGAGVNEDVNFIVLFDRTPGLYPIPGYDSSHGNWTGSRYYKIAEDQSPYSFESILLEDLGEVDMSDPETLRNFLVYCFQNYPAKHYCLDIWNHGWGVNGMCLDETDGTEEGGSELTLNEIQRAITNATSTFSTKIDVISMDACNMQTVEVAWELRNLCDYLLASEAGTNGWEYEPISQGLYDDSSLTPLALCKLMVDAYKQHFGNIPVFCLSVIDMAIISDILPFFNDFAEQLTYVISELNYGPFLSLVRQNSFGFFYGEYVDIEAFAKKIKSIIPYEPLQLAVDELVDFLDDLVVYNWQHQNYQGFANGLMVYLPFGERDVEPSSTPIRRYIYRLGVLTGMDWQEDSYWDEFLAVYSQKGLYNPLE
ncbi:MAG: clostripain-related cysteine peptidase, partial [Candidatus Hermodarchaeota archaeon]